MLLYHSTSKDPCFNIASEEYFLKNFEDNIFMLYLNNPAVVVGKHQNALAEINYPYVKRNNIKVIRRLSGGGTVYHDEGNINFCFIQRGQKEKLVDFKKFTRPILEILHQLSVPAEFAGKSDLIINDKKFSGNAEHVFRNKVMHHGTILFSSNLKKLSSTLKVDAAKYQDNAVKSNRSKVTNIIDFTDKPVSIHEFIALIIKHIKSSNPDITEYTLSQQDTNNIHSLMDKKYSQWEWNFGYSPKYLYHKVFRYGNEKLDLLFEVDKGIIETVKVQSHSKTIAKILQKLSGSKHKENDIHTFMKKEWAHGQIMGMDLVTFVEQLF